MLDHRMPSAKSRMPFSRLGRQGWSRRNQRSVLSCLHVQCRHKFSTYSLISQVVEDTVKQYKLLDSPWVATGRVLENGMKIPSVSPQAVISAVMLVRSELAFKGCSFFNGLHELQALNKCELNLYGRVTLSRQCADQRTLFIFR